MNSLQEKQLDMFKIFLQVCEKVGIDYYLIHGSALGAVKYQGFIPWDDDIDVGLLRKDYQIFVKEAQKYLPENMFLQNFRTDKNFPRGFSKLRDSNTTYIEITTKHMDINQGVFLDIFPLDNYVEHKMIPLSFKIKKKLYSWVEFCALRDQSRFKIRLRNTIMRALGFHKKTAKYLDKLEKLYMSIDDNSKFLCEHNISKCGGVIPREWYSDGAEAFFEGIKVRIPKNYDAYLTFKYGDWRAELQKEKQVGHHGFTVCDLEKPYTDYINKNSHLEEKQC